MLRFGAKMTLIMFALYVKACDIHRDGEEVSMGRLMDVCFAFLVPPSAIDVKNRNSSRLGLCVLAQLAPGVPQKNYYRHDR